MLLRRHHGAAEGKPAEVVEETASAVKSDSETLTAPAGNASRDAWAEYAINQGINPATVETLTREEIKEALENLSDV